MRLSVIFGSSARGAQLMGTRGPPPRGVGRASNPF